MSVSDGQWGLQAFQTRHRLRPQGARFIACSWLLGLHVRAYLFSLKRLRVMSFDTSWSPRVMHGVRILVEGFGLNSKP